MMKKKNLFEQIKQFFVQDVPEVSWWIDECDMEDFKNMCPDLFEDGNNPVIEERTLSGKQWNEWLIGSVFGDFEGHIVDEDCPKCGHLLVAPNEACGEFNGMKPRFCSDCDFINEDLAKIEEQEDAEEDKARNAPPEPKFIIPGQTLEQFCEKYGFDFETSAKIECITCKRVVIPSEFYRTKTMAVISYEHKNLGCTNGPLKIIPQGEKRKEWEELMGAFSGKV